MSGTEPVKLTRRQKRAFARWQDEEIRFQLPSGATSSSPMALPALVVGLARVDAFKSSAWRTVQLPARVIPASVRSWAETPASLHA